MGAAPRIIAADCGCLSPASNFGRLTPTNDVGKDLRIDAAPSGLQPNRAHATFKEGFGQASLVQDFNQTAPHFIHLLAKQDKQIKADDYRMHWY